MKTALITGITGQDGSYLAELLMGKGYDVHGIIRRSSSFSTARIDHLYRDPHEPGISLRLHYGDLLDAGNLTHLVEKIRPDEIYNLGAQSHVQVSFDMPDYTVETVALGTLRLLEATRYADWPIRFYQAGSSEMFGMVAETPQRETTPFHPRSPYAAAKVCAHHLAVHYREAYELFTCNGILFNHESPRRGGTFVTRKVTRGIADILTGNASKIYLGNLEAQRDWGYAPEYVEAMWRMLQHSTPDDYVIATGKTYSVRDLVAVAFALVGLDWKDFVEIDPRYLRPTEVDLLLGDATKARRVLGWEARTSFTDLVELMLASDLHQAGLDLGSYPALSVRSAKLAVA